MPRPDRYREREGGGGADTLERQGRGPGQGDGGSRDSHGTEAGRAVTPQTRRERREELDGGREPPQGSGERSGEAAEGAINERVARRLGWVPQDEWKRDPTKWVGAEAYLDRTPARLTDQRDRLRVAEATADRAEASSREVARRQAEAELRAAVKDGKEEEAVAAASRIASAAEPAGEASRFMAERPWLSTDRAAQALAYQVCEEGRAKGLTTREQLAKADEELRKRYPEHHRAAEGDRTSRESREPGRDEGGGRDGRREERSSREEPRRESQAAPDMAGGTRSGGGAQQRGRQEKGFDQLPSDVKAAFDKTFRSRGVDPSRYARNYWRSQGE